MLIQTTLSFKQYLKLIFILDYTKPVRILISIIGVLILGFFVVSPFLNVPRLKDSGVGLIVFAVIITVINPVMLYVSAKKIYYSSGRLQGNINYNFSTKDLKISGDSFTSELAWEQTYKIVELKNWFLLFQNKVSGNFIAKENLSQQQINAIRDVLKKVPVSRKKLLA